MKRRRALLASSSCLVSLVSGCLGGSSESATETLSGTPNEAENDTSTQTVPETPVADCDMVYRPSSPSQETDLPGEDERYIYPQRPESLSEASAVISYVSAYERAYRMNDLYSQHGTDLEHASLSIDDSWTYEAPNGAAIVRLKCTYGYVANRGGSRFTGDSPTIYVSYYISETVVLRAVERGYQEDESNLVPDPIEQGRPVECF